MTFGAKLRELRDQKGMTQAGLADASGIPIGTIRDYEQVRREPLLSTAMKLAEALGVSVEAFKVSVLKEEAKPVRKPRKGK